MLNNYFKIAYRNLLKNKGYSFINIFGLAIGLCSFILIGLYILDEVSYDRFYKNANRIYRINSDVRFGGTDMHMATSPDPFGPTLKKDYPEVEQYTRIYAASGSRLIKKGTEFIEENALCYTDSTFFDIFSLPIIERNTSHTLREPQTIVISKTAAQKYFGSAEKAVGQTLEILESQPTLYKVTAVYEDMPANSHFHYDFLLSMHNAPYQFGNFLSHNFHTYVRLGEGTDYKVFEKKFEQVIDKYILPRAAQLMQISSMDEFKKAGNKLEYSLMPITDIHLKSDRSVELSTNSSVEYIYIFGAVAFFLLLIACINFMNLSTARSTNRAKEIGIRKVMGTERKTLISQFIIESVLVSYIAFIFALILAIIFLPYFNTLSAKAFTTSTLFKPQLLPFLLLLPLIVGILAGYYPAFFLSKFRPIEVLKTKLNAGSSKSSLRNILVTAQFSVSLILIICTIIVYKQLNYIQTKNLGFSKEQILVLKATYPLENNRQAFKNEVLQMAGMKGGSFADFLPVDNSSRSDNTFSKDAVMTQDNGFNMQTWRIDDDYIPNLGMELVKGRNFSKQFPSDSSALIINETTAKLLGYDNPIGKKIYTSDGDSGNVIALTIIGVVKNFHFSSLRQQVGPLAFELGARGNEMAFKIDTQHTAQLLGQIEAKWKKMVPGMPFRYEFLNESFDNMYRAEQRIGKVALTFALLTILIACLGLFGLVTYMIEQRIKEIGIRKVLGASVPNIVQLVSKDFLKLVFISILIASPIAYYFMRQWLSDFAFSTDIVWWIFVLAGVLALLIAFFTVSYQSIRAALMNPVKSLKTE